MSEKRRMGRHRNKERRGMCGKKSGGDGCAEEEEDRETKAEVDGLCHG